MSIFNSLSFFTVSSRLNKLICSLFRFSISALILSKLAGSYMSIFNSLSSFTVSYKFVLITRYISSLLNLSILSSKSWTRLTLSLSNITIPSNASKSLSICSIVSAAFKSIKIFVVLSFNEPFSLYDFSTAFINSSNLGIINKFENCVKLFAILLDNFVINSSNFL